MKYCALSIYTTETRKDWKNPTMAVHTAMLWRWRGDEDKHRHVIGIRIEDKICMIGR